MRYAVLCYSSESAVGALSAEQDEAMMSELAVVHEQLAAEGKFGPAARLMDTAAATTVRHGDKPLVMDGPFAETKEQLLGFYVLDCATPEEAVEAVHRLAEPRRAAGLSGALEIRPMRLFLDRGGSSERPEAAAQRSPDEPRGVRDGF